MLTVAVALGGSLAALSLARSAARLEASARAARLRSEPRGRLPRVARARLVPALAAADVDVAPEAAVHAWLLAALTAGGLALAVAPPLAPLAAAGTLAAGPVVLYLARHRRARRLAAAVPDALERVASELRSGGTVTGALAGVAASGGPLAADLARVGDRRALGAPVTGALAAWAAERDTADVRAAAGALAVAAASGGRAAAALDGLAASLRDRLAVAAEVRALATQARLSAVVIGVAPLAYLAFSAALDPGSASVLVGTAPGRVCLLAGLGLEAGAAWWMRRIVREDPV